MAKSVEKIKVKHKHAQIWMAKDGWRTRIVSGSAIAGQGKIVFESGEGYHNLSHAKKMVTAYTIVKRIYVQDVSKSKNV